MTPSGADPSPRRNDRTAVVLRPFRLGDATKVAPWLQTPGLSLPPGSARVAWPKRLLGDSRIAAFVGTVRRSLVAFARLDCGPDRIAEVTLVVAPKRRRDGIGAEMIAALVEEARRRGIRRLQAMIDEQNGEALRFFLAHGFEESGIVGARTRLVRLVHAGDFQSPLEIEV